MRAQTRGANSWINTGLEVSGFPYMRIVGRSIATHTIALQAAGLQYTAQPAHDSDSEGSDLEGGYSDEEDWLEDEVQVEDEEVCLPTDLN